MYMVYWAGVQALLTVIFPKTVVSGAFKIDAYSSAGLFGMICGIFIAILYLPYFFKVSFIWLGNKFWIIYWPHFSFQNFPLDTLLEPN